MSVLRCEICEAESFSLTSDGLHVICSTKCAKELERRRETEGQEASLKTELTVQGHGEVKVTPDRVRVTLDIVKRGDSPQAVNLALIESSNALIDLLKNETNGHAEKIQTGDVRIDVIREKTQEGKEIEDGPIIGYEGHFPIIFEATIANAGPVIDKALQSGHTDTVQNLEYYVSEEVERVAYNKALRLATLDGQEKADVVLKTLRLKMTSVKQIRIENIYQPRMQAEVSYASFKPKSMLEDAPVNTQLIAGETIIAANVTLTMSYQ